MFAFIKDQLNNYGIDNVSCLSLDECVIKRPYLLERNGIDGGSVIIFTVPYLTKEGAGERNVSSYAVSKDYHLFFSALFKDLINTLEKQYPSNRFTGFTDHSPIDEIDAAAKAGLGVIGRNHLLITKKYSSYIFIGEIVTDASLPSFYTVKKYCLDCGKCISACPFGMSEGKCLSAITQKKGELDESEKALIKQGGCVWGCDICQEICPLTEKAIKDGTIYTSVEFFKNDLSPTLTSQQIEDMDEEDFRARAYSWRGKGVIARNLKILEEKES